MEFHFSLPTSHNNITCNRLQKSDIKEVAQLVANAFLKGEPLTSYLKIPDEDMFSLFLTYTEQIFDDGLCLVCHDHTARIVGVTLCRDLKTEVDYSSVSQRFLPIFALLDKLVNKAFPPPKIATLKRGQGLEIFATAVEPTQAGKGIGRWLIKTASAFFAAQGYAFSISESTSPITQSLRKQCGFEALATVEYDKFEYEGEKPFAGIDFSSWKTSFKFFPKNGAGAVLLCKNFLA